MTRSDERFAPIESYGIVGNLETCALIGPDGSVDWFPFPHVESPSVFTAILDPDRGGRFEQALLAPVRRDPVGDLSAAPVDVRRVTDRGGPVRRRMPDHTVGTVAWQHGRPRDIYPN